jgi:hypothetical protein
MTVNYWTPNRGAPKRPRLRFVLRSWMLCGTRAQRHVRDSFIALRRSALNFSPLWHPSNQPVVAFYCVSSLRFTIRLGVSITANWSWSIQKKKKKIHFAAGRIFLTHSITFQKSRNSAKMLRAKSGGPKNCYNFPLCKNPQCVGCVLKEVPLSDVLNFCTWQTTPARKNLRQSIFCLAFFFSSSPRLFKKQKADLSRLIPFGIGLIRKICWLNCHTWREYRRVEPPKSWFSHTGK